MRTLQRAAAALLVVALAASGGRNVSDAAAAASGFPTQNPTSSPSPWFSSSSSLSSPSSPASLPPTRVTGYGSRAKQRPAAAAADGPPPPAPLGRRHDGPLWRLWETDDGIRVEEAEKEKEEEGCSTNGGSSVVGKNGTTCGRAQTRPNGVLISAHHDGSMRLNLLRNGSGNDDDDDASKGSRKPSSLSFTPPSSGDSVVVVEGLFGVYRIPSGHLWVWIAESEACYDAPPLPTPPASENACDGVDMTHTSSSSTASWWQIRRVTRLHATVVTRPILHMLPLPRVQRASEHRQIALLRQALKHHDWYYCPTNGGDETTTATPLVPDLSHNLQSALLLAEAKASGNASWTSERRPWWSRYEDSESTSSSSSSFASSSPLQPYSRFFWNKPALEELVREHRHTEAGRFLLQGAIPVTSAFVGVKTNLTLPSGKGTMSCYDHLLLTRRSRFRAGTRFTRRGADHTGAVANYAETEQVIVLREGGDGNTLRSLCSHVQTRGSVPLRWSSPADVKTYRPRVRIGTDPLAQARAVALHLFDQLGRYAIVDDRSSLQREHPALVLVNLVDRTSDQGRLGRAFDAVLRAVLDVYRPGADAQPQFPSASDDSTTAAAFLPGSVRHVWYDFHAEVRHGRWGRLAHLLEQVDGPLREHGYFLAVPAANGGTTNDTATVSPGLLRIERLQLGLVRTNCMDCLDRTNVVQGLIGRSVLFRQLDDFGLVPDKLREAFNSDRMTLPWQEGEVAHRLLWADNADAVSRLYAGTPALKGDFTRTGRRTKRGALDDGVNSLHRYYRNNFRDADRQEGIDLLVGYRPFAGLSDDHESLQDSASAATTIANDARHDGLLNLKEAAHRSRLGKFDDWDDDDRQHIPIKWKRRRRRNGDGLFGVRSGDQAPEALELRWLPGDLRTHVRGRLAPPLEMNEAAAAWPSRPALQALDERAASDAPWWVTAADSSSESELWQDGDEAKMVLADAEMAAMSNPGYLIGALLVGTTSPTTMAVFVLAIMVASFPSKPSTRASAGEQ